MEQKQSEHKYTKSTRRILLNNNNINGFSSIQPTQISNLYNEKIINQNFRCPTNYSDSSGFCSSDSAYWQMLDNSLRNSQIFDSHNSTFLNKKSHKSRFLKNITCIVSN